VKRSIKNLLLFPFLASLLLPVAEVLAAEPSRKPDRRTLLLDHLDAEFVPDGKLCTEPTVMQPAGAHAGGRPMKGGRFVPGRLGKALEFSGPMNMVYPGAGNIDRRAGALSFWVAQKFDAAALEKGPPSELRNQLFVTVQDRYRNRVVVYSTLKNTCLGVWDRHRQLVCYGGFPSSWRKDEWHFLELRWGRQLELWCDGEKRIANAWDGLFGPLDVNADELAILFGSQIGYSDVHSEFLIDELCILGPGEEQMPRYPLMTVPRIPPPRIDGRLDDQEWAGAARCDGFVALPDDALASNPTHVYLGWDQEALFIAMECRHAAAQPPVATLRDRDAPLLAEDSIGILLMPQAAGPSYQLLANAIGTFADSRGSLEDPTRHDTAFNPRWDVRISQSPGGWIAEARIPFAELDGRSAPAEGERWRADFFRSGPDGVRSSWALTGGDLRFPECFGEIVFSTSDRAIRIQSLGDWTEGKLSPTVAMTGLAFEPAVTVAMQLVGADARVVAEAENRLTDYTSTTFSVPPLVTGLYTLVARAATEDKELFYRRLPFRVDKPFDVAAEAYPYEGKLWITSNIGGMESVPAGLTVRCKIVGQNGEVGTCQIDSFDRKVGRGAIDIASLPAGSYTVAADATAPDGRVLARADTEVELFPQPTWWRSEAGVDHTVPAPWTPVEADGKAVRVWGREYVGTGALPAQIINQNVEMLAGPIRLSLTASDESRDLATAPAEISELRPDAVIRTATAQFPKAEVEIRSTTEFDGMQRCDLFLRPRGEVDIASLTLEIPIKRAWAEFLLSSSGHTADARRLTDEPWAGKFLPQVWIGNDDLGLAWFAESDQHWSPNDDRMIEVVRQGETVMLRCNIIRTALKLAAPARITFGLMATPVKSVPTGDPFWFRFASPLGEITRLDDPAASQMPKESCRYPALGNLDTAQGTLEFWLTAPGASSGPQREIVQIAGKGGDLTVRLTPGKTARLTATVTNGEKTGAVTAAAPAEAFDAFAHVALTWGDGVGLYLNGKRAGTMAMDLPKSMFAQEGRPRIGFGCANDWRGYTRIAIDELRVSDARRYTADTALQATAAFAPDEHTLLLDHFDDSFTPDGEDAETAAAVIAGRSGELGGLPSIGCRFVPGRFGQAMQIAVAEPISSAAAFKQWGANAMLYWFWFEEGAEKEGWPPPLFVPPPRGDYRDALKRLGELGVGVCPYMAYLGIGAPSPLSRQFGAEWARHPLSTSPSEPPKGHYFLDACGASGFADYLAAGTQWLLDGLGFHGCYTDGNARCYRCSNTHHGCGYRDGGGMLRATWPVFATREYLKRMYKIIHARHDNGYLVNHVSYDMFIPTMSFTDVYYTGEHEHYEDLVKCRVRWQAKPWGIWPILPGGDSHSYEPLHMTYGLLHATSVWPMGVLGRNDMLRKTVNLWQTYDRFRYREAEWIPYYRAEEAGLALAADRDRVKVSLYRHPEKRVLAIVGNLADEAVTTSVRFDSAKLGWQPKEAENALSGRPIPLDGESCQARLRPNSFLLVWLK